MSCLRIIDHQPAKGAHTQFKSAFINKKIRRMVRGRRERILPRRHAAKEKENARHLLFIIRKILRARYDRLELQIPCAGYLLQRRQHARDEGRVIKGYGIM